MKSRWTEQGACDAIARWGDSHGEAFALRLYSARLIGNDPALVLHGGGNVSLKGVHRNVFGKEVEALYVKASGYDLSSIESEGLPSLDLAFLRKLRTLDSLSDDAMVNELRAHLFDASAPTPSIEALVHAFVPAEFVDHSHADALLAVTNHADGEKLAREAMGDGVAILPYIRPGFDLAKAVADCCDANPDVDAIVLLFHGLITFGDDARATYERHIELVDRCERFMAKCSRGQAVRPTHSHSVSTTQVQENAERIAPILRGLIAVPTDDEDHPYQRSILEWRSSKALLALIQSDDAVRWAAAGPLTGDHIIRTRSKPLLVSEVNWSDRDGLREQIKAALDKYRGEYGEYVKAGGGSAERVDSSPRVVWLPDAGLFCWGRNKREACVVADIAEATLKTMAQADAIAPFEGFPEDHRFDMEFRGQQQAKLTADLGRPLEGQIVVISGGAGAIGAAVAAECVDAGAHVVVADLDWKRVADVAQEIDTRFGTGSALGLVMDVTDEQSVQAGYAEVVRTYGGVDVVVPNAGVAHVSSIEDMDVKDFRRVMDINATGYMLFMREGVRVMKRQGLGGHVVINASKSVFGPGAQFGAYSASKAAGHQLGKVAAIELAPVGIRVNMINADAIFGEGDRKSGLWAEVGPSRAKSRKMSEDELPEFYRGRNLLKTRVYGHHVGKAVVFFASNATPTTGATLPVDGGLVDAFPR